jgi:hypothetical protein
VIEEPRLAVLVIFLEWDTVAICDVDGFAVVLTKENADDSFVGSTRY